MICIIAGNISLKVPPSLESKLDLKADSVSVDKQFDMASLDCTKSDAQEHVTGIVRHVCFFSVPLPLVFTHVTLC